MSSGAALVARKTALVIIDLQNDFLDPQGAYARGGDSNPPALLLPARVAEVARALKSATMPPACRCSPRRWSTRWCSTTPIA